MIESVVEELKDVIGGHVVHVAVGEEILAVIDPGRIHHVLGNLISDAVKYGAPDTEIRIEASPRGELVELVVMNHGPGIPAEELPLLFNRFTRGRAEKRGERPAQGLGLGLYIARGLVEAHGGRLWAESIPGETTSFHFTVPRAPHVSPFQAEPSVQLPADESLAPDSSPRA